MKWGTVGAGKGDGEGEVSLQATWDQVGQGSHHTRKEGFQVSKRDSGTRGVIRGSYQGELSRGCAMCLLLSSCTYVSCYCVNVANKRIVFRL